MMCSITRFLIFLYVCETSIAVENGYVWIDTNITCADDSSSIISNCSALLDYEIPDFSNHPNPPDITPLTGHIAMVADYLRAMAGEQCSTSGTKYLCQLTFPFRCEETNIHVDWEEVNATCEQARNDCSSLSATFRDSMFNCSIIISEIDRDIVYELPRNRSVICDAFPDLQNEVYPCETNYQVGNMKII